MRMTGFAVYGNTNHTERNNPTERQLQRFLACAACDLGYEEDDCTCSDQPHLVVRLYNHA